MDDRRHTNHAPAEQAYDTHPVGMPPGPVDAAPLYPGDRRAGPYSPEVMHDAAGFGPAAWPATDFRPYDFRPYHAEIARLRHRLASAHAANNRQATEIRRRTEQALAQQKNFWVGKIETLQQRIAVLQHESQREQENREQKNAAIDKQLAEARGAAHALNRHIATLKHELKHVALAASSEQQELKRAHDSIVNRHHAAIAEQLATIESLQQQMDDQDEILEHWKTAQEQAVQLSEWYETEHERERVRYTQLVDEFARFRSKTSEAFAVCEDEIETLEATVGILQTDHEIVELINADLDHLADKRESEIEQLQAELEAVSEEKTSLIETVAGLKSTSDDFDASLFAKDQEIDATKRLATEAQRQLEQTRRENKGLASQNDQLRHRAADLTNEITKLQTELADAKDRADRAESMRLERDHQIREIQSAARAADANALLRANEAEQQYAVELQRLEDELERQKQAQHSDSQLNGIDQAKVTELEHALAASQRAVTASSTENDRLQQTIDQLHTRLAELQRAGETKADRVELLEDTLSELRHDASNHQQENVQLRADLAELRSQLAESADRIATAQHTISQQTEALDQKSQQLEQLEQSRQERDVEAFRSDLEAELAAKWQAQVTELEQNQVTLRERHHQAQLAQQQTIESLQQQLRERIAERDSLKQRDDASGEQIRTLQSQLADWSMQESPVEEVKRLSNELSRCISQHAREREALLWRIEQLQTVRALGRAA
ncbi:Chromosome partition protein Smc [Stieleria neptunia]|uniref:Chromosome partition protein Smc n=1 Tax=Stieleria neptunia TaxID=2527979 RepID=A0A518HP77_9BACT|nr:hypothetical protein [Stieleria neptunia]QDV42645.1 Chromosome partition protein Smc [Stieleria neptunia]